MCCYQGELYRAWDARQDKWLEPEVIVGFY